MLPCHVGRHHNVGALCLLEKLFPMSGTASIELSGEEVKELSNWKASCCLHASPTPTTSKRTSKRSLTFLCCSLMTKFNELRMPRHAKLVWSPKMSAERNRGSKWNSSSILRFSSLLQPARRTVNIYEEKKWLANKTWICLLFHFCFSHLSRESEEVKEMVYRPKSSTKTLKHFPTICFLFLDFLHH